MGNKVFLILLAGFPSYIDSFSPCLMCSLQTWNKKSGLGLNPDCVSLATGAGKVYAVEGSHTGDANDVYMYDPPTNRWTSLQSTRHKHINGALVFHNQCLVILGGSRCEEVEQLDLNNYYIDNWYESFITLPEILEHHFAFIMELPQ